MSTSGAVALARSYLSRFPAAAARVIESAPLDEAVALLERETLDEAEVYAAAGLERPPATKTPAPVAKVAAQPAREAGENARPAPACRSSCPASAQTAWPVRPLPACRSSPW